MKRIFISSTFKDMQYERDVLHEVAAKLNVEASRCGDGVELCDLRSGVNTLGLDSDRGIAKVLSVCIDEIDRCRPYMIVLLGDRYGSIPNRRLLIDAVHGRCKIPNRKLSVTALEVEYGALLNPEQIDKCLFYFRDKSLDVPADYKETCSSSNGRLADLKKRIIDAGGNVRRYRLEWDRGGNVVSGLDSFAEMVRNDLVRLFQRDWRKLQRLPFDQSELLIHLEYMKQVGGRFLGRHALLSRCLSKVQAGAPVFAVQGRSGTGKTTLLSHMALKLYQQGYDVLPIFCGLTVNSDDARDVMRIVIRYCSRREALPIGKEDSWDAWTGKLVAALERRSASGRRLVIVIDGVDQLRDDDGRNRLLFMPPRFPDNVQMVLSGLQNFNFSGRVPVMKIDNLSKTEASGFLNRLAGERGAELDREVQKVVLSKPTARSPLFLGLLRYRLGLMDRDDYSCIESNGGGMVGISRHQREIVNHCGTSLKRLCMDILATVEKRVSGGWVRTVAFCIAISRRGLRETDLEGILTNLGLSWSPLEFARFRMFLRPFFFERDDGRIDCSHSGVRRGLCPGRNTMTNLRNEILKWFDSLPGQDNVRDEEFCFACQEAGRPDLFLRYIVRFLNNETTMVACAKAFYSRLCIDGAMFANRLVGAVDSYEEWMSLCDFVNFHVYNLLDGIAVNRTVVASLFKRLMTRGRSFTGQASDAVAYRRQTGVLNRNLADLLSDNATKVDRKRSLGFYRKAKHCFERGPGTWCKATENDYRDIVSVLLGIGAIYEDLNAGQNARKALDCYLSADKYMKDMIKRFGKDSGEDLQFNVLYHLGDWYWRAGKSEDLDMSETYYKHALSVLESAQGAEHFCASERDVSVCFTRLAQYHHNLNTRQHLKRAIYYGGKALKIDERIYRANRTSDSARDYMQSCTTLSEVYVNIGSPKGLVLAKDLCLRAISIGREWLKREPSLEAENILAQSYGVLSNVYRAMGENEKNESKNENLTVALRFCRMSVRIFQRLLDSGFADDCHSNLSCSLFNMGVILYDMGGRKNIERAKRYLEDVWVNDKYLHGKCSSWRREDDFIETNVRLGNVCRVLGGYENFAKAMQYYRRAARLGDCDARFSLGCMYEEGLGVKPDKTKALHYFKAAAADGQKDAICRLRQYRCE